MALVERDGRIRTRVVEHVNANNLKAAIRESVKPEATIHTDELNLYAGIGKEFATTRLSIIAKANMPATTLIQTRLEILKTS